MDKKENTVQTTLVSVLISILGQLKNVAFICICGFVTYEAMKMANDPKWIFFLLFAIFAL